LKQCCRCEDVVARWGGDEFVVFMPLTDETAAEAICKRITKLCRKTYVENMPVSLALGTACKNDKDKSITGVLKEAENDMYRQKLAESRSSRNAVISALLNTLKEKSFETEEHTREMLRVAQKIGSRIGLSSSELNQLKLLITMHDIGKINIPEEILTKGEALTPEEWAEIKKHPETGYRIARAIEEFSHVAIDILTHHERWDGTGYPQGLKKKEIPLLARITAIADAYEIMLNSRPYKKKKSKSEIAADFKRSSGIQFDPELVEVFLKVLEDEPDC